MRVFLQLASLTNVKCLCIFVKIYFNIIPIIFLCAIFATYLTHKGMSIVKKVLKESNSGLADSEIYRDKLRTCILSAEYDLQVDLLLDRLVADHQYILELEEMIDMYQAENAYLLSLVSPF